MESKDINTMSLQDTDMDLKKNNTTPSKPSEPSESSTEPSIKPSIQRSTFSTSPIKLGSLDNGVDLQESQPASESSPKQTPPKRQSIFAGSRSTNRLVSGLREKAAFNSTWDRPISGKVKWRQAREQRMQKKLMAAKVMKAARDNSGIFGEPVIKKSIEDQPLSSPSPAVNNSGGGAEMSSNHPMASQNNHQALEMQNQQPSPPNTNNTCGEESEK
jgi:hypothetical protein